MVLDSIKGSGKIATKTLNYSDFNSIDVSNSFKLNIIQSTTDKVIIRYDDNLEDFLNLSQESDKISFGFPCMSITLIEWSILEISSP